MKVQIGLSQETTRKISQSLNIFLASTYALYLKTQNFHWNLKGPDFYSLHILFEKHYTDMAEAIDEIAERIQSLGFYVDATFSSFQKNSKIKDAKMNTSQRKMVEELLKDHEIIARLGRPLVSHFQEIHDDVSSDMLIKRLTFHEKAAWMLRSHLEK